MISAAGLLADGVPLAGKDYAFRARLEAFPAWKSCVLDPGVTVRVTGRRYLRLDQKVDGYARLSPSIMREFLNYTVVGLKGHEAQIDALAERMVNDAVRISEKKIHLAAETIERLLSNHPWGEAVASSACFMIAGDVVFSMAHDEPRPETSTGELVRGSDLDIIAIAEGLPPGILEQLDSQIYREKHHMLMNPALKEELDYVVKDISLVEKQLGFADFKSMVASKIMHEGRFLCGSRALFGRVKAMLEDHRIPGRIDALERVAVRKRQEAEEELLARPPEDRCDHLMPLFYTTEEKEEIF